MADSPFDFKNFVDTSYQSEGIDTKWHAVPDKWEGIGQIVDMTGRELPKDKFNGRNVVGMRIIWSLKDPDLASTMNIDDPRSVQDIILELTANNTVDWGTNKNMGLKRVIEAVGLLNTKKFSLGMLMNQAAWLRNSHRPNEERPEEPYSNIDRVSPLEAGRRAWEAKQAA